MKFRLRFMAGVFLSVWYLSNNAVAEQAAQPVTLVGVAAVTSLKTAPRSWTPGTVLSRSDAELGVEVAGMVTWVADPGTRVVAGEVVAQLDSTLLQLAVDASDARVRALQNRLVYLRSEATRLASLAEVNSAAKSRLEESVANRDVAIEDLQQARANLQVNQYRLEKTSVVAPFAGQIVERLAETGEYMNIGRAVVRLVDTHHVEVRSRAPLRVSPFVREGMTLPVRLNDHEIDLPVKVVIPVGDLSSRTFEVRLQIRPDVWAIGTPVQVGLPSSATRQILTVPRDAMVLRETGPVIYQFTQGVARQIPVQTGTGAADRIEVIGTKLVAGDQVVVRGAELLRDGQAIAVEKGSG